MVSARRKYACPPLPAPRTTRNTSPSGDSLSRVWCRALREPPSAFSPYAPASPSTRVDLPDPFSPTRNVTPAGMFSPWSSTAATAGMLAHQDCRSTVAAGSRSIRRTGRGLFLIVLVAAGQPRGETLDRGLELGVHVDKPPKLLTQPLEGHGFLAAPVDQLLDATVGEIHGSSNVRRGRPWAPLRITKATGAAARPRSGRAARRRASWQIRRLVPPPPGGRSAAAVRLRGA